MFGPKFQKIVHINFGPEPKIVHTKFGPKFGIKIMKVGLKGENNIEMDFLIIKCEDIFGLG
jgi:hypothetical protein